MNKKNKSTEPKSFKDILELQKILDANIHSSRERTLKDILIFLVAEIIEFNEETKYSHKTWKTKPYNRENELEELTDIFFFFAQWVLKLEKYNKYTESLEDIFNSNPNFFIDTYILIRDAAKNQSITFFEDLMMIVKKHGYTKDDILKTYWIKWQRNMERIGKDWN